MPFHISVPSSSRTEGLETRNVNAQREGGGYSDAQNSMECEQTPDIFRHDGVLFSVHPFLRIDRSPTLSATQEGEHLELDGDTR